MLARTADNLYWLARYMERADFLARILDATRRLATVPTVKSGPGTGTEWDSVLEASGAAEDFRKTGKLPDEATVVDYLTFDEDNPSSICNCLEKARMNARGVRTALTAGNVGRHQRRLDRNAALSSGARTTAPITIASS